jgi:hypothetical protein
MTMTNPYKPPSSDAGELPNERPLLCGKPCAKCGSPNTSKGTVLRNRPNILFFVLFGWLFLLIQGAMAMRSEVCRDCGAIYRYKSTASWFAIAVLVFLALCVLLSVLGESHK